MLLYRLGADEGAAEGLLLGTIPGDPLIFPLDGLALIRINYAFAAVPGVLRIDRESAATQLADGFTAVIEGARTGGPNFAAIIVSQPPLLLNRILVILQPYFAIDPPPFPPDITVAIEPANRRRRVTFCWTPPRFRKSSVCLLLTSARLSRDTRWGYPHSRWMGRGSACWPTTISSWTK